MTTKSVTTEKEKGENVLDFTESLCPECWLEGTYETLPATIFSRDGKVYIKRNCKKHGETEEIYWGSEQLYLKMKKYAQDGPGIVNPFIKKKDITCPTNCGYCKEHLSCPALGNLVVTNRCDLNCWYCFFFAERAGYVYEPSLDKIREMVKVFRSVEPVPGQAIQLTGGEPSLREDIVEIINILKEEGITHIQFNTDGIKLALDKNYATKIRDAGVNTVYLSFDGTTPNTNPKNHWEVPFAVQNAREAGHMGIVFVPTVINTINDHDLGNIVRTAFNNIDTVRGINFQPVSLTGRITKRERSKLRITSPDVIKRIEEQTDGQITIDDWYTVPCVGAVNRIIEAITKRPQLNFTNHFACGLATYVFLDEGKFIPIPQFVDVDGFFEYLVEKAEELEKGKSKTWVGLKILWNLRKFVDNSKKPKWLKITRSLFNIIVRHNYNALGEFHMKTLMLGMMHFQDLYNYDVNRTKRCNIIYLSPDKRLIPFCSFNSLSMLYRDAIQPKYGIPLEEWEEKNNMKLKDTYYKRDIKKLTSSDIYKKFYEIN
jgi:uncharacterized radical SAM superfamily Fe-S cluster-containing enzyme